MKTFLLVVNALLLMSGTSCDTGEKAGTRLIAIPENDPLPSWNDGTVKHSIINFVKSATDSTSANFIPITNRIATFDNDGTLWAEKPYVQELFAFYRVKEMVKQDPTLTSKQPFKAVIQNDKMYFKNGGEKALLQLVNVTHTGITEDEFDKSVQNFFSIAVHPTKNVSVSQLVYQPQLELLNYLRDNKFKTFICTGGTVEFVRGISEQLYGVPKEQVIGTTFNYKYVRSDKTVMRLPGISLFNDKEGKPVGIQQHVGKRPVFACGNEGGAGDIAMLEFCQSSHYPSFQLLINHDDSLREFSYQEKDSASLKAAKMNKWTVVSMKNDWAEIFPKQKSKYN